jgi:hypothetical protein
MSEQKAHWCSRCDYGLVNALDQNDTPSIRNWLLRAWKFEKSGRRVRP